MIRGRRKQRGNFRRCFKFLGDGAKPPIDRGGAASGNEVSTAKGIERTSPARKGKNQGMTAGAMKARKPRTNKPNSVAGQRPKAAAFHGTR